VVGYFHYDYGQAQEAFELFPDGSLGPFARNFNEGDSDAIFGQLTLDLSDDSRLTLGGRYTKDERYAEGTTPFPPFLVSGSKDDSFTDWKIAYESDLSEDVLFYAQAATGFRPGGVSPFDGSEIQPEELLSYELGVKSRFWDNRAQLNASLFYYDYSDYQVIDFFIGPTGPNLVFYNADVVNKGAELEFQLLPNDYSRFNLAVAYLDSEIDSDICLNPFGYFGPSDASCSSIGAQGLNFKGERLPHAPEWQIKGGYEYEFVSDAGWSVTPRIDLRYVSEQFVAPNNQEVAFQDSYFTGEATLKWQNKDRDLSVTGFVKNLNDEAVKNGYFVGYSLVSSPRTYGVTITRNF
jgi:iron complex outermembrane receptor protein